MGVTHTPISPQDGASTKGDPNMSESPQREPLGVPHDHPEERAWRIYTMKGVVTTNFTAALMKRQDVKREWARVGLPLD